MVVSTLTGQRDLHADAIKVDSALPYPISLSAARKVHRPRHTIRGGSADACHGRRFERSMAFRAPPPDPPRVICQALNQAIAASTPPLPCGTLFWRSAISTAPSVPSTIGSFRSPIWPRRNTRPPSLPSPPPVLTL